MKVCSKCNKNLALSAYHNLKTGKYGKSSYCKECAKKGLRKWTSKNEEYVKDRRKRYSQKNRDDNNIQYFKEVLRNQVRRYIIDKKGKRTEDILGETFDNVRRHIEGQFKDGMSWSNYGEWHIDHIIPLSSGRNKEEYIKLNNYKNLQPLWAEENMRKGSKVYEEQGRGSSLQCDEVATRKSN